MRKLILILTALCLAGCVTVKIPKYLTEESPYKKKYFSSFEETLEASKKALGDLGWKVSDMTSPSVFEQSPKTAGEGKQILIFTEVRQTPFILASAYMSVNVFLRTLDDGTEVEIRYMSVMPMFFKNIESFKNDRVVKKIFNKIDAELGH